jgi:hypothetical protein
MLLMTMKMMVSKILDIYDTLLKFFIFHQYLLSKNKTYLKYRSIYLK